MGYTYFSTTQNAWEMFKTMPSHLFNGVNTAFVEQQMAVGKEFVSSLAGKPGLGYLLERNLLQSWGYLERVIQQGTSIFSLPH